MRMVHVQLEKQQRRMQVQANEMIMKEQAEVLDGHTPGLVEEVTYAK